MWTRRILLAILLVSFCCLPGWANDSGKQSSTIPDDEVSGASIPSPTDNPGRSSFIMPEEFGQYRELVEGEIAKKIDISNFNQPHPVVTRDPQTGAIISVLYGNALFNYSYTRDDSGNLVGCTIASEKGEIKIVLKLSEKIKEPPINGGTYTSGQQLRDLLIEIYIGDDSGNTGGGGVGPSPSATAPAKPVVVYRVRQKVDLEDIAQKPIKFDLREIKKAVSKTAELKDSALKEYMNNTSKYYEEVEKELKNKLKGIESMEARLRALSEKLEDAGMSNGEKRTTIDKIVEYVYVMAEKEDGSKISKDILVFEKSLREKILNPEKAIYDKKIEAALEYVHGMIDTLVESKLALFLNLKKDKIEVVVNLPELANKSER